MHNGTVKHDQYYIRYDDGTFEDGCDTLDQAVQEARETYDSSKRLWRTVTGVYQNSELIVPQDVMDMRFEEEDELKRRS